MAFPSASHDVHCTIADQLDWEDAVALAGASTELFASLRGHLRSKAQRDVAELVAVLREALDAHRTIRILTWLWTDPWDRVKTTRRTHAAKGEAVPDTPFVYTRVESNFLMGTMRRGEREVRFFADCRRVGFECLKSGRFECSVDLRDAFPRMPVRYNPRYVAWCSDGETKFCQPSAYTRKVARAAMARLAAEQYMADTWRAERE